jgi:hypothetical protein
MKEVWTVLHSILRPVNQLLMHYRNKIQKIWHLPTLVLPTHKFTGDQLTIIAPLSTIFAPIQQFIASVFKTNWIVAKFLALSHAQDSCY